MVESIHEYIETLNKELNGAKVQPGICGNEFNLIRLVETCRFIYDKNLPEFRNREKIDETWSAIGKVFGLTGSEVSSKWRNMRDLYCKTKKRPNPNVLANNAYLCEMTFLDPYIKQRRSKDWNPFNLQVQTHFEIDGQSEDDQLRDILTQFIKAVEKRPVLYKKDNRQYKDQKSKIHAWQEISKEMGASVKACWLKWKNLRESFAKSRKLERNGMLRKPFEYKKEMSFLEDYIRPRRPSIWKKNGIETVSSNEKRPKTESNIFILDSVDDQNRLSQNIEGLDEEIKMLEFIDTNSSFVMSPNSDNCEEEIVIEKFNNTDIYFENSSSCITDHSNNTSSATGSLQIVSNQDGFTPTKSNVEDDLFAQSVAEEMKKIPSSKRKLKLKADIYKLLYEAMDDDI